MMCSVKNSGVSSCRRFEASFAYYQEQLVFQLVGQLYAAQLQAAAPSGYFIVFHRVENVSELFYLFFFILIGRATTESVQFLVVIIFYLFAYGSQQTFFFAYLVLSAAFTVYVYYFWSFFKLSALYLFCMFLL